MVGKTGRKCSSHGINVIAGGSQGMEKLYKGSPWQNPAKSPLKYIILWSISPMNAKSGTWSKYEPELLVEGDLGFRHSRRTPEEWNPADSQQSLNPSLRVPLRTIARGFACFHGAFRRLIRRG